MPPPNNSSRSRDATERTQRTEEVQVDKTQKGRRGPMKKVLSKEVTPAQTPGISTKESTGTTSYIIHFTVNINLAADSEGSSSSDDSDSLVIIDSKENQDYLRRLTLGKLSRLGRRSTLWNNKLDCFFVIVTFLMSYDSLVSFTIQFERHGVAFCLAYAFMMLIVGFPLMYMELALGQYTSGSAFAIFDRIAPGFVGVGLASVVFNFMAMVTDQGTIPFFARLFSHAVNIFTSEMPWHNCATAENVIGCRRLPNVCEEKNVDLLNDFKKSKLQSLGLYYVPFGDSCVRSRLPVFYETYGSWSENTRTEKYQNDPLGQFLFGEVNMLSAETVVYPAYDYYLALLLSWGAVFFVITRGRWFIVNQARLAMMVVVGSMASFIYVFVFLEPPDFAHLDAMKKSTKLSHLPLWSEAFFLTLRSLKLGQGGLIFLGGQNNFHNHLLRDTIYICVYVVVAPFTYAIVHLLAVDSAAMTNLQGDMYEFHKTMKNSESEFLFASGYQMIQMGLLGQSFRLFKEFEPVLMFTFSLMGILLVLANKVVRMEILLSSVVEFFPSLTGEVVRARVLQLIIFVATIFMFIFVSQFGLGDTVGVENLVFPVLAAVLVVAELAIVCLCYGPRRLFANITFMINKASTAKKGSQKVQQVLHAVVMFQWCFVIPVVATLCIFVKLRNGVVIQQYTLSAALTFFTLSLIPIMFFKMFISRWRRDLHMMPLFKPDQELWGPRSVVDRKRAEAVERQFRPMW